MEISDLFLWLVQTHVQVLLLASILLVLQRLLSKHMSPRLCYFLWALLLLRLLIPAIPSLGEPVAPLAREVKSSVSQSFFAMNRKLSSSNPKREVKAGPIVQPETKGSTRRSSPVVISFSSSLQDTSLGGSSPALQDVHELAIDSDSSASSDLGYSTLLLFVWLGIAGLLMLRFFAQELYFQRTLRRLPAINDQAVLSILNSCMEISGYKGPKIRLLECDEIQSPAVTGWRQPTLLLPAGISKSLSTQELHYVFLHELMHLRSRDIPKNAFMHLLACLHWFNPIVWLATKQLRANRESVRDRQVLEAWPQASAQQYAQTFIKLLKSPQLAGPSPILGYFLTSSNLKGRIMNIQQTRPLTFRSASVALIVIVLFTWVGFAGLSEAKADNTSFKKNNNVKKLDEVTVFRQTPVSQWERELNQKLDSLVNVELARSNFHEVVSAIAKAGGVNIVVDPRDSKGDLPSINFSVAKVSLRLALSSFLHSQNYNWGIMDGVIFISREDTSELVPADLRMYDVSKLVESGDQDGVEALFNLIEESLQWTSGWRRNDRRIGYWNNQVTAILTNEGHKELKTLLTNLVRRGASTEAKAAWKIQREALMDKRVSIEFDGVLGDAIESLSQILGLQVVVNQDVGQSELTLSLTNIKVRDLLANIARVTEASVQHSEGILYFAEEARLGVKVFDLEGLVDLCADEEEVDRFLSLLEDLLPDCRLNSRSRQVTYYNNLLVVTNTEAVHGKVDSLLSFLRKASKSSGTSGR